MIGKVKTFEDALALYKGDKEDIKWLLSYTGSNPNILASVAFLKLSIITEVLNEDWTPDWDNSDQYKYYPYFDMRGKTIVFDAYWSACSDVSSRLCLSNGDLAEYCGKQFIDLYKDLFIKINKEVKDTPCTKEGHNESALEKTLSELKSEVYSLKKQLQPTFTSRCYTVTVSH
jgi:hypothetical protein